MIHSFFKNSNNTSIFHTDSIIRMRYTYCMFDPVDPRQSFSALEHGILDYWKEEDVFRRSVSGRDGAESFSFFDGPPFATGLPHYGHLLAGTIKDVIPRYQTMRGKKVERRFGWDCHGLPVEYEIEKEYDIKGAHQIKEMGTAKFNDLCRGIVQRYTKEWRTTVERMGRWVDMDNDYKTMDPKFMESIWWAFGSLYDKKLIYEGYKPMQICPRCVTPLANFEVTQGYKDVTDQSATVKFELMDEPGTFVLAWTTTPWTLPGNLFLAVHPETNYVRISFDSKVFIVAESRAESIFVNKEYEQVGKAFKGKKIIGLQYKPLFPYFVDEYKEKAFKIVGGDFVTIEDGTGIVHIAPGFGEDDFKVGQKEYGNDFKPLQHVTMDGKFVAQVTDFSGVEVKPKDDPTKTDKKVVEWLKSKDLLFAAESYRHSYAHCWRCDSPLLNYATSSWFVNVEKVKNDMLLVNAETEWVPAHLRDGRFGKWLEGARDWAISRNRYWGTPLPIWRCTETGAIDVINGRDDLMAHKLMRFTKVSVLRHAQSEGNLVPMYQSVIPGTNLTDLGREQAANAAKAIANGPILPTVIYCSPLARTMQTAEAIAKETGAQIIVDERLREGNMGEHEGKTIPFHDLEVSKELRKEKAAMNIPQSTYHLPGMETWQSIQDRMNSFFEEVLPKHPGDHIVVVSHGDPIHNIRHFFTHDDPLKLVQIAHASFATPETYFWDHEKQAQMDLHKDVVDDITWPDSEGNLFKRIPEVLDCWFESGSMPYAQSNFPFNSQFSILNSQLPSGFPADFIAEGIDQTRGWFYTLTVLSAALFKKPAFHHCIVNGTVLAEDGRKMSKRLKNYPDPTIVIEKYGADALRFALMSSPAVRAEDLRFSEAVVEDALRSVLLPLWNSYSFFVTYATAAKFEPVSKPQSSNHPLDKWIKAEVQDLVNRMTEQLDNYDLSATCNELFDTIDALTNWYIRLSRRRFAGKNTEGTESYMEGSSIDQQAALTTLYDVLITVSQLLAPFCPFITEAIYLNLVPESHGSIHLTDWPNERNLTKEEMQLLSKNRVMRLIVRLGNKIRSEKKIKVRQPLSKTAIAIPVSLLNASELTQEDLQLLKQELNVKDLTFTEDAGARGQSIAMVDARKVGPRLGGRVQEIIQAGKRGEFSVEADGEVLIMDERLTGSEVQIVYRGREGEDIAAEGGVVVSMETAMSDALIAEGLARDLIRCIQKLRKESDLKHTDRIILSVEGMDDVLKQFGTFIAEETKAELGSSTGDAHEVIIEDLSVVIRFQKI